MEFYDIDKTIIPPKYFELIAEYSDGYMFGNDESRPKSDYLVIPIVYLVIPAFWAVHSVIFASWYSETGFCQQPDWIWFESTLTFEGSK